MKNTVYWGIIFIVIVLLFVGGALILNSKWTNCSGFVIRDTGEKASCGVWKFGVFGSDSSVQEKYVGYGRVIGMQFTGQTIILKTRVGLGEGFSYVQNFRLSPRKNGKFEISEERRKWIGYFDNSRMIRFGMEEVPRIKEELKGKEIMLVYSFQGDDRGNAWKQTAKMQNSLTGKIILMFKGLLNLNTLDATQAGY